MENATTQTDATQADAPVIPPPDPKSKLGRALIAFVAALDEHAASVTGETDAQYAAALAAFDAMPAGLPGIAEARAQIEVQRDAGRKNARDAAAALARKQYATFFDRIAKYGAPPAPIPTARGNRAASNGGTTKPPIEIRDADGVLYVKDTPSIRTYTVTGDQPCGDCPLSTAHATVTDKVGNFRQNVTRAIAKMSTADLAAHASCMSAIRDREATDDTFNPLPMTVTFYKPAV